MMEINYCLFKTTFLKFKYFIYPTYYKNSVVLFLTIMIRADC